MSMDYYDSSCYGVCVDNLNLTVESIAAFGRKYATILEIEDIDKSSNAEIADSVSHFINYEGNIGLGAALATVAADHSGLPIDFIPTSVNYIGIRMRQILPWYKLDDWANIKKADVSEALIWVLNEIGEYQRPHEHYDYTYD